MTKGNITWVKNHGGITGNNIVDTVVKEAINLPDLSNKIIEYLDAINMGK